MAEEDKNQLSRWAKSIGVEVDALKDALKKYGLDEADLKNQQKRTLLADAIEGKWSRDQFKGRYDTYVADSADWDWEQIVTQYGYSLGVLKEYGNELRPIFKWLAGELQKGETPANLKAEFDRRVSQTKFGDRTSTEIEADLARFGSSRKDYQANLRRLTQEIRRVAVRKYGEGVLNSLSDGKAWDLAASLVYDQPGFLDGNFDQQAIEQSLMSFATPATADGGEVGGYKVALNAWLSANGVVMTGERVNDYVRKMESGALDFAQVKQDIRNNDFVRQYAGYADLFKQGQDVADIAMDFRQSAANLLEKSLDSVTIDDPLVKRALQYKGADGKPVQMALYEFEREVRKTPEWDMTNNAMAAYTDIGETILRNFGFRG